MTVVFHDENLYTQLKIEAVKRRTPASSIIADALHEWLESREDAEILPMIREAKAEYEENGGRPWSEVASELESAVGKNKGKSKKIV